MNTAIKVSLVLCACLAYAWALPAELAQSEGAEAQIADTEVQESLEPAESGRGYYGGWGHRGYGHGGGWGYGGGYGFGGGWGHGGHYGGHYGGGWGHGGYGRGWGHGYGR